ncbi:arylsulfatase [Candidatus Nitrospira allomarina]|uniref:Arylsulfatase n=1 Tax=Candidatus Nitrospira allomarina TaxID=3020900 RepID=A0AA96GCB8_9BACT|nr:arylsulfatase [Candidatus Nitrospira allomarina]WNM57535.1 arylsulfatase [Candidatus Nitrospira allomarina]
MKGVLGVSLAILAVLSLPLGAAAESQLDRTVLPIHEPEYPPITKLDARNATPPPRFEVKAPADAPNVLLVMIDDMGFGMPSAFGGPIHMPTAERLANQGLRYNHFHTTALCSPTRAALLSGRNHHMNNMGAITEMATPFPGNTGRRPNNVAPLAEMLRLNGYSTAFFGKNHETAAWEVSPSGPTDRWPTRSGFDKFYGFIGGETNQWAPLLYDGLSQVELSKDPNYHFMNDMTNQAIHWMRYQKSLTPDKPFFIYFAPGATHAPHHVPKEWIEKYKGKFDGGWDQFRAETLSRQIKLGVVPAGTKLASKPEAIKDWDKLTADEKKLFARQMEVFAGFGEYTDREIGRLVQAVEQTGHMDNTLIIYIIGDNGTSAEGGMSGLFNEMTYFNRVPETVQDILKHYDDLGGPMSYPHMAAGWAVAGDTPFMWTKQVPSNFGGTRNGMVIHWPQRIKAKGEIRQQFHHVIDVAPTVLEAAGLPEPSMVNGTKQAPIEGVSMVYTFDNPKATDRHTTQYFEIMGNRGIYADGWFAGTVHRAPWEFEPRRALLDDIWELYDTRTDFSLSNDLAAKNSDKLKELQALFLEEAVKYRVLPIDDRLLERVNAATAGRPDLMDGRTSLTLYEGMEGMSENVFINIKNRSHTITAQLEIPDGDINGVILAQAGRFGGWSLYVKDGKPTYTYNFLGLQRFTVAAPHTLEPGKVTIRYEFVYEAPGMGKGGVGTIFINDQKVAEGKIEHTQCCVFSADEGADVGLDEGTPVIENYGIPSPYRFNGTIKQVTVDLQDMTAADRHEANQARIEYTHKKALSD